MAVCGNAHFTRKNLAFNSLKTLTNSTVIIRLQTRKMRMITLSRHIELRIETFKQRVYLAGSEILMDKFLVYPELGHILGNLTLFAAMLQKSRASMPVLRSLYNS